MTDVYWMDAKPKAQLEKEQLFGLNGVKYGKTITENSEFAQMIDDLREKANWSDQGMKKISMNNLIFFCVKVVHQELTEQLNGKIPLS